jgi:acyl-coenzyme A thioesterase PaaI-like protein
MSRSSPGPESSLQQRYAPRSRCFGCGPANEHGLRIESRPARAQDGSDTGEVVAEWSPEAHHEAFDGVLNGGIIGALLDCHSNWTAAWHLMSRRGGDAPPVCVTAEYAIKLLRPTPTDRQLRLRAHVVEATDVRATVEATMEADGRVCATCRGTFIAVRPGHPAYGSWDAR